MKKNKNQYPGISLKVLSNGEKAVRICFTFQGTRCQLVPHERNEWTADNRRYWSDKYVHEIKYPISNGTLTLQDLQNIFPHSQKIKSLIKEAERKLPDIHNNLDTSMVVLLIMEKYIKPPVKRSKDYVGPDESTYRQYLNDFKAWINPFFKNIPIVELDKNHAKDFYEKLARSRGKSTVNHVFGLLSRCLDYAVETDLITVNPCKQFTKKKFKWDPGRDVNPFTINELKIILDHINPAYRNHIRFTVSTFMRQSELYGTHEQEISYNKERNIYILNKATTVRGGEVREDKTKTIAGMRAITLNSDDMIIIKEQTMRFQKYWREKKTPLNLLFLTPNGYLIDVCHFRGRVWMPMFKRIWAAGIEMKYRPPKQLRHTGITLAIMRGLPIDWISARAGHTLKETTEIYYKYLPEEQQKGEEISLVMKDILQEIG